MFQSHQTIQSPEILINSNQLNQLKETQVIHKGQRYNK